MDDYYSQLKSLSQDLGVDLFGAADISNIKDKFNLSQQVKTKFSRAICLGVRLSNAILEDINNEPTRLYFHHYRALNNLLDQIAIKITNFIQRLGFNAFPIPASQIIDWQNQRAHLSHKEIGYLAGLGWRGRNNLLVNENFGSQFRLVTILTDIGLTCDKPKDNSCGNCFACVNACPAAAIKEKKEEFDHVSCFEKLKEFQRQRLVDQYICGVCVKACPPKI